MKITLDLELTPANIEKLKIFCNEFVGEDKADLNAGTDTQISEEPVKKKTKIARPAELAAPAGGVDSGIAQTTEPEKISLTDVRAIALKLSKSGQQDLLKAAFAKFGGKKLSDIKEDDYAGLLAELSAGGAK